MFTFMGTVDGNGWRWLLVAVGDQQSELCSENSGTSRWHRDRKCHGSRISCEQEAHVSHVWLIRDSESFIRES